MKNIFQAPIDNLGIQCVRNLLNAYTYEISVTSVYEINWELIDTTYHVYDCLSEYGEELIFPWTDHRNIIDITDQITEWLEDNRVRRIENGE